MWRKEKGEESGLREAKPGKASLTDGVWLLRAWRRALPRSNWSGFVGCGGLLEVDTEKHIRDFQSPDLGDGITVGSFTGTDTAWDQKQFSGKRAAVVNSRVGDACGERSRSRSWLMSAWVWSLEMTSFLICLPFKPETIILGRLFPGV